MGEKLSRLQAVYLMFWVVMGTGIIAIPFSVGQFTVRDGWISTAIVLVTLPAIVSVSYFYQRTFPGTNLVQAFFQVFGRPIGKVLALWYLICLYATVTTIWRELVGFLDITVYPRTPSAVLAAILAFPVAYGVYKGIHSIGLFSEFLAPLAGGVVVVVTFLSMGNVRLQTLTPVLADGWTPILRGAMVPSITYVLEPLVVLMFLDDLSSPKTLAKDLAISLIFVFLMLLTIEIVTVGTLGPATGELRYPVLEVVRSISVAQFIERLDTLYGMGVVSTIYIKASVFQYAFSKTLKDLLGLSSTQVVAWTGALVVWAGSMALFPDAYRVGEFIIFTTPAYFICTFFLLPLMTIVFGTFRKAKGTKRQPAST